MKVRVFNRDDAVVFHRWFHDENLKPYFRLYPTMGLSVRDCENMPEIIQSGIHVGEDDAGKVVAAFTFHKYSGVANNYRLGFLVDTAEQHKKYAWDIGKQGMDFMLNYMNAHRLDAWVLESDQRLIGGLKEYGFMQEGKLRDSIFYAGKYHNEIILSYLRG